MTPGGGLTDNLARIRSGIAAACERSGRDPSSVTLVAASKFVVPVTVTEAFAAGVTDFGENFAKEMRDKKHAAPEARWHYLGSLQASNAPLIAEIADVVHGLEPGKAGERLARRAEAAGREIPSLLQVDFTGTRAGVSPDDVAAFATEVQARPGLRACGLMTLPPMPNDPEDARPWFRKLREIRDALQEAHPRLKELSMGMSLDYEVAVEEGATMVRVGTALFGERPPALGKPNRPR
jgi:pyridoxal phosphate enzyme (YggS family)